MSNLLSKFAISNLVPTPSVYYLGFLKFLGIFVIEPNPPILVNFFLPLSFVFNNVMNFTNLSAAAIFTPLYRLNFFYSLKFIYMKSKILLVKSTLYLIIFTLALLKIFFSTTFSYAESFDIKNVEISKQFNMNFKRTDILDEGFKIAYNNLILNITKSKDQSKLKDLSQLILKQW